MPLIKTFPDRAHKAVSRILRSPREACRVRKECEKEFLETISDAQKALVPYRIASTTSLCILFPPNVLIGVFSNSL